MSIEKIIETDVLVIGGGIAGCCAAIEAKEKGLDVTIVDKGHIGTTGCTYFSGMNFTAFNPEMGSDFDLVMRCITEGSEYTNDRDWTETIMKGTWAAYEKLAAWGVEFPIEEKEGRWDLENRIFKITLNPQTGAVASIYDKELKREIVDSDAPHELNQFVARWV